MAGTGFLVKPTERLHLIPSLTIAHLKNKLTEDFNNIKDSVTAYTVSINARYHLEQGLWLSGGYNSQL